VRTVAPGREADGFRDLRVRNPRQRIPGCAGNETFAVKTVAPGREADGFRDLRVRNPRQRIPGCAG
jgi:hypothetical protein